MSDNVRRGYCPTDEEEFVDQIGKLRTAGEDIRFFIDAPVSNSGRLKEKL